MQCTTSPRDLPNLCAPPVLSPTSVTSIISCSASVLYVTSRRPDLSSLVPSRTFDLRPRYHSAPLRERSCFYISDQDRQTAYLTIDFSLVRGLSTPPAEVLVANFTRCELVIEGLCVLA